MAYQQIPTSEPRFSQSSTETENELFLKTNTPKIKNWRTSISKTARKTISNEKVRILFTLCIGAILGGPLTILVYHQLLTGNVWQRGIGLTQIDRMQLAGDLNGIVPTCQYIPPSIILNKHR